MCVGGGWVGGGGGVVGGGGVGMGMGRGGGRWDEMGRGTSAKVSALTISSWCHFYMDPSVNWEIGK